MQLKVLVTALALVLAACASSGTTTSTEPPDTSAPPTTEAPPTTAPPTTEAPPDGPAPSAIDWDNPSVVVDLGDGWKILKCEGDGPFMCVERDGVGVGALEGIAYPVASFDDLDPAADPAATLAEFVAGFHESLGSDRAQGCGADYQFEPIGPESITFGDRQGVAYGFEGRLADGSPSELNLQYAAVVGDRIVSVTAIAYDEGGCPGRDDLSTWDSATLSEFWPLMDQVLEVSPLPNL